MFIEHIKSELMTLPNFNQLSTTIGDNLYKGSNANNNNNSLINIPYHNDNLKSTILTPTSPNTNIDSNNGIDHNTDHLIKDSPFFVQPPFQPFSYSTSPNQTNLCQISPIKCYNDNNYDVCDTKHFNDNYCDLITSIADTPDSIFDANKYNYGPATPITSDKNSVSTGNDDPNSQIFFKFDADVIERYNYQQQQHNHQTQSHQQEDKQQLQLQLQQQQQQSVVQQEQQQHIVQHQEQSHQQQQHHFSSVNYNSTSCNSNSSNLDQDYFNYNEINCQSKNQSPCSSPSINPWMSYMATIPATADGATTITTLERCSYDNGNPDNSPKHNNNDGLMQYPEHQQKLPPIGTVFNYQNQYMNTMSGSNDGENTFNDCCFDTTFLEQFNSSSPTSNDTNLVSDAYLHPLENYNLHIDNKPNREYKDIWYQNATEEQDGDAELDENYENDDAMNATEKDTGIKKELEMEPGIQEPVVLQCLWTDCNLIFPTQSTLVSHIEKNHIELRKGEEFACFWLGCIRRYRPFNARYKLLVHMRVHTLEKPNKCPFSGCNKAFSRLENLKIHQRSHTGERPYGCQYEGCLKAFSNSSDRAKHQRTHYDTKPYACQVSGCTKRYTDPSSLRKHVKNHNGRDGNATGRRKSYKDNSGNSSTTKMNKTSTRRRYSESSVYTKSCERDITPAPQTPIILENMSGENSFIYDDVFTTPSSASPALKPNAVDITSEITTNSSMNFDDMTNCIINMLEPPTSHTATSTALNSPSYNLDENNIDTNEFVSYEYVKRFLNDNIDYNIESNINLTAIEQSNPHSNYEVDFFNNML